MQGTTVGKIAKPLEKEKEDHTNEIMVFKRRDAENAKGARR